LLDVLHIPSHRCWRPFIFFGIEQHDTRQERKQPGAEELSAPRSKETLSTSKKKDFQCFDSASKLTIDK